LRVGDVNFILSPASKVARAFEIPFGNFVYETPVNCANTLLSSDVAIVELYLGTVVLGAGVAQSV
jgi:hypothetical protein